jgi:hypothetical protein
VATKLRALGRLDSSEELLQKYAVEDTDFDHFIPSVFAMRNSFVVWCGFV